MENEPLILRLNAADRARLLDSPLFSGTNEDALSYALTLLEASERRYARGDFLHRAGEPFHSFGFLLSGSVGVYADDLEGRQMLMAAVSVGETFGESLSYLASEAAPVYILASEETRVLYLRTDPLRHPTADPRLLALRDRFTAMLAARTLAMNDRIQILCKHTLREKLLTFFAQCYAKNRCATFTLPYDRAALALYLGCDRAALSRELSAMQREGILEYYRSSFRILRPIGCNCNKEMPTDAV